MEGGQQRGYSNPAFDEIHKRLNGAFNSSDRDQVAAYLIKVVLDQALYIPLSYSSDARLSGKGLSG